MLSSLGITMQPQISTGNIITWMVVLAGIVTVWIKTAPDRVRARTEADGSLRADLFARIGKLDAKIEAQEALIASEREECHIAIARLEAQLQLFRHARNNADARFQALLMLLKRTPDDVPGVIRLIEEMVQHHERTLAAEKGAMMGATLWSNNPVQAAAEQTVEAAKETLAEVKAEHKDEE